MAVIYVARPGVQYTGRILNVDANDNTAFIEYVIPGVGVTTGWRPISMLEIE